VFLFIKFCKKIKKYKIYLFKNKIFNICKTAPLKEKIMRVNLNLNTGLNPYIQNQSRKQNFYYNSAPFGKTFEGKDTVTFSVKARPVISTEAEHFNNIRALLLKAKNGSEKEAKEISVQIADEVRKVVKSKEKSINLVAQGVKRRVDEKAELANELYKKDACDDTSKTKTFYQKDQSGHITRKIIFENGTLALIEEDGPFDTKNIMKFEKGILSEYKEGYKKSDDGEETAERIISYLSNGNLNRYAQNCIIRDLDESYGMLTFFNRKGKLTLYQRDCKFHQYMPTSVKRYIHYKGKKTTYAENFKADRGGNNVSRGAKIEYINKEPVYAEIQGRVLFNTKA